MDDAVVLLIDHQSGLFQRIGDIPKATPPSHTAALAKMVTLSKIPVITTASVLEGSSGPPNPEFHQNIPFAKYVARKGEINGWENADFVIQWEREPWGIPESFK
jgi:nicotinamidase-related amidase